MARRPSERSQPVGSREEPPIRTTITLSPSLWADLQHFVAQRKVAGDTGCSASRIINQALQDYLDRHAK